MILGIKGYKFLYGYDSEKTGNPDESPKLVNTIQIGGSPTLAQDISKAVMPSVEDAFLVQDSLDNPQDGKTLMQDATFQLVQWANLDWTKLQFKKVARSLRKFFAQEPLPFNVKTLYIVYYFKANIRDYPVLTGSTISIAIPVKGSGPVTMDVSFNARAA